MFGEDDEILQDFLVEAGEIIEQLSEQLVDLEQRPDDRDLLNAIFRGFHTVKGGAGFLQLNPLVDCCHVTENLFDILRNGQRAVTPELMDVVLQALDVVTAMFDEVQNGTELTPADPQLLANLTALVECRDLGEATEEASPAAEPASEPAAQANAAAEGDITDAEFEQFLDAIAEPGAEATPAAEAAGAEATGSDEISDDEFEALLDQLHGKGQHGGAPASPAAAETAPSAAAGGGDEITDEEFEALLDQLHGGGAPGSEKAQAFSEAKAASSSTPPAQGGSDEINDDEFEALLDQLHGQGQGPTAQAPKTPAAAKAPEPAKPAQPAAAAPAAAKTPDDKAKAPAAAPKRAAPNKDAAQTETTVRVDTQRLDDIMNMVGELVLVRNRLVRLGASSGDEVMAKAVSNLDVVTADLQTAVMKTRMQPIKKVFGRFPRVVRDLARNLKKEISLELQGEETDLDKNLVEALADPLVHLVRNSVDHGIEMPDDREAKGKSRVGKVILAAEQEGDQILLSITDDGAGMDPDMLRRKAIEKGLFDEDSAARLSDSECFDIIFMPGFSTKVEISDVSGRGVGMDVVKTKITQLNGSIEIKSKVGEGTRLEIKVPLTLAIMPTLMVMLGDQTFAFPLVSVNEIFHMNLTRTNVVDGHEVVIVRDRAIPLFYLKRWLVGGDKDTQKLESAHVVIVSVGTLRVGFVVDQLIGQEEVVIKPLGKMLHGTPGMAGATITGDGRIALILDVPSMLKRYAG
ncbi:chemotaxis protein CheA [Dasania sp. GY-MA-18]|uniref:Chemotaxis protein CheA n=1 Tax=Dasania phycosphaerae TaxID=2950436 RepID=A0A9J6RIB3_9GAMM|nr:MULTISPECIES: chemotaxis protein CheA [Dasania]MCR8921678.1 chemotaxis protein CheA [Dasania sp. GY-MA-18]MCZ0864106.1 chemotaxis protein CheA [Dasania phycosphaerae]MCZ0867834.1 chemotaxis protein CheA [Dasania phycosphaerae]